MFKIKQDGTFQSRLVAKGYDQIAGVDFQYNYAPVSNEITLRILLIMLVMKKFYREVADMQTAFLYRQLDKDLYLKIPKGYQEYMKDKNQKIEGDFLKLNKSIYGLVQAARSWWKKFVKTLINKMKFTKCQSDGYLLKRKGKRGTCYLMIYVDDCFITREKTTVTEALNEIERHFDIKRSRDIEDFIGCSITIRENDIILSQPDLIKKLMMTFGEDVKKMKQYNIPASGGYKISKPETEEEKLTEEEQTKYRSGVGLLLYLLKHSRPDLSNCVRELTKTMSGANPAHYKAILQVIKFMEQTKHHGLLLQPKTDEIEWRVKAFSDSDYAGDTDTRKSVSGFVIYLNNCPIAWRS